MQRPSFYLFKDALLYARSLKLASSRAWTVWHKSGERPKNVPSTPEHVYKHAGWQGYGHWLGTGNLRTKVFLPFKEAQLYARSLKLKTMREWKQ